MMWSLSHMHTHPSQQITSWILDFLANVSMSYIPIKEKKLLHSTTTCRSSHSSHHLLSAKLPNPLKSFLDFLLLPDMPVSCSLFNASLTTWGVSGLSNTTVFSSLSVPTSTRRHHCLPFTLILLPWWDFLNDVLVIFIQSTKLSLQLFATTIS